MTFPRPFAAPPWLIPAWAGKTPLLGVSSFFAGAHPRVGGENIECFVGAHGGGGSSPRGRGKPRAHPLGGKWQGLIPAWAGKTAGGEDCLPRARAHPRVGGENRHLVVHGRAGGGSSPRGRGKLQGDWSGVWAGRLIPAWAGKTRPVARLPVGRQAHPRVGGENRDLDDNMRTALGSSPRGRGKHVDVLPGTYRLGLIPAWAGKTHDGDRLTKRDAAHPRVGGENLH